MARVDVPAGTPAKDILARGDLIQKEVVQDDQLPGVLITTAGTRRHGPQAGSLHRPAGLERRVRPAERGRLHDRDPRHHARRRRRRQGLQRPRRHPQGRRPRRRLRAIGTGNARIVAQGADQRTRDEGADRRQGHDGRRRDAHILFALSDRDAQKILWLADNAENSFWLAQRPQENALNSPPTVETLQTVLGDGLPAAMQKLIKSLLDPAGATQ